MAFKTSMAQNSMLIVHDIPCLIVTLGNLCAVLEGVQYCEGIASISGFWGSALLSTHIQCCGDAISTVERNFKHFGDNT